MKLILRADVENLGNLGDVVTVKPATAVTSCCPRAWPWWLPKPT